MTTPLTPEELLELLEESGYETRTIRHPALFTVAESQRLRGTISGRHTKNLFLKDKKDGYYLVTVGEDRAVDLKNLHRLLGASGRVSFGKKERLIEFLGVPPGSVTAFSVVNDRDNRVKAILDKELMAYEELNAHPLTNEATTTIRRDDLISFMSNHGHPPLILDLSQPANIEVESNEA